MRITPAEKATIDHNRVVADNDLRGFIGIYLETRALFGCDIALMKVSGMLLQAQGQGDTLTAAQYAARLIERTAGETIVKATEAASR